MYLYVLPSSDDVSVSMVSAVCALQSAVHPVPHTVSNVGSDDDDDAGVDDDDDDDDDDDAADDDGGIVGR